MVPAFEPVRDPGPRPLLSVVTVSLQAAATIEATLASVAAQTRRDLEHLVIDGGSSDGTCEVVRRAAPGARLVSERDRGIFDAMNKGVRLARGEWLAFLNADDAWAHEGVVEALSRAARVHPEVELFHGDVDMVDARGAVVRRQRFVPRHDPDSPRAGENYAGFATNLPVYQPASFTRRSVFERLGGFDERWRIAGDYDFYLRAWLAGVRMRPLPEVVARMRHDGVSERRPWLRGLEVLRISRRRTGRLGAPLVELLRFETVHHLDLFAPWLVDAVRAVKRRVLPSPSGAVSTWAVQDRRSGGGGPP